MQQKIECTGFSHSEATLDRNTNQYLSWDNNASKQTRQRRGWRSVCFTSPLVSKEVWRPTNTRALIVALWGWRLFITTASDVCAAPPPMHTAAGLPFTHTHTELLSPSHSGITGILAYLWAQSLHHVTEEVIQLFALNVAIICWDRAWKFSEICPHRSVSLIFQPLIPANSSASVCAFNTFRHSCSTVFI